MNEDLSNMPGDESGSQSSSISQYNMTLAARFHKLFLGCERAHGSYGSLSPDPTRSDGKLKGKAVTIRKPVTDALWERHLRGEYSLGVIPICDDGTCLWGCIDLDIYQGLDHVALAKQLAAQELPLIPCRSKSGGAHLLLLCTEPIPAKKVQDRLRDIAAFLGHGKAEVFPVQTTDSEDRDLGNWVNAPYFDHEKTNRYAVIANRDRLSAEEFLELATLVRVSPEWFDTPLIRTPDPLPDGPPCLNHLMTLGFPPGTWDSGVFNLGIYCRKARPDDWGQHLAKLNAVNFPPDKWPVSDLNAKIKSLSKKRYNYQCNVAPLTTYCDRTACKRRKYGVGAENLLPDLSSLSMLLTDPPIWFLEIDGHNVKFATEELLNPVTFQVKCANCGISVPWVGRADWSRYIGPHIVKANRIPIAEDGAGGDFSAESHFLELLDQFLTGRSQARSMGEVLLGKPYTTGGRTHFRISALQTFLVRKGFKDFRRNELVAVLRAHGAKNEQQLINGQTPRIWNVPEVIRRDDSLPLPPGIRDQGF